MSRPSVEQVADAVLYEGYILYPYRPSSVKNRQRWTFGGVYPRAYSEAQAGTDAWEMRTECLVVSRPGTSLTVRVHFLHLFDRQVGELTPPLAAWPGSGEPAFRLVPMLQVGDRTYPAWQEATEREVRAEGLSLADLLQHPVWTPFTFPAERHLEPLAGPTGEVVGVLVRQFEEVEGEVEVSARAVEEGLARLAVCIRNRTDMDTESAQDRERALRHALISTHTILNVADGEFVSLLDPPEQWKAHAEACGNVGTWPVLAGEEGDRDTLLSSPIILYDYPQVAPESAGDLFDATEIDEILTLRILTLTEEEKREMASSDERARQLLERTEALAREQLLGLHGAVRSLRPVSPEGHDG
jgi:hypothetical protein